MKETAFTRNNFTGKLGEEAQKHAINAPIQGTSAATPAPTRSKVQALVITSIIISIAFISFPIIG